MYDFPECKYTYFSLIDKSLGHLFHLPASILTIPSHEDPTTILHVQKSAPKQTHSQHATPSRDPIMTRNPATKPPPQSHATPPPQKTNAPQKHQTKTTPYNVSSRALAAILSPSLSVYFTSIGRYFFSSFTLPEDLAMRTRFLIAVRSSALIFITLL